MEHSSRPTALRTFVPMWREACLTSSRIDPAMIPDMGNVGVALNVDSTDYETMVYPVKTFSNVLLEASICALPFLPPNTKFNIRKNLTDKAKVLIPGKEDWNQYQGFVIRSAKRDSKFKMRMKQTLNHLRHKDFKQLDPPEIVLKMASRIPEDFTSNDKYIDQLYFNGGGVHYQAKNNSTGFLLHSSGQMLNQLVCTPVMVNAKSPYLVSNPDLSRVHKFSQKIFQVATSQVQEKVFCATRFSGKLEVGTLNMDPDKHKELFDAQEIKGHAQEVTDFCFSSHIPSEYVFISANGAFSLCNVERKDPLCNQMIGSNPDIQDRKWSCKFSSTPRTFLFASDSHIILKDTRVGWQSTKTLLHTAGYKLFYDREKIQTVAASLVSPYLHYAASDYQLTMFDTRYPGSPVLVWKHQLQGKPTYCHSATYKSNSSHMYEAIVLTSRESRKVALFSTQHTDQTETISLTPTVHISTPSDFVDALVYNGQLINLLSMTRTNARPEGLRCVSTDDGHLTVLQQTECGDVFYQDFSDTVFDDDCRPKNLGCCFHPQLSPYELDEVNSERAVTWIHRALKPLFKERAEDSHAFRKKVMSVNIMNDMMGWCRYVDDEGTVRVRAESSSSRPSENENMSPDKLQEIADQQGLLTECQAPVYGTEQFDIETDNPAPTSLDVFSSNNDNLMREILSEWNHDDDQNQSQSRTQQRHNEKTSAASSGTSEVDAVSVMDDYSHQSTEHSSNDQGQSFHPDSASQGFAVPSEPVDKPQRRFSFSQDSLCDLGSQALSEFIPSSQPIGGTGLSSRLSVSRVQSSARKSSRPSGRKMEGF